jgi:hypothetical protein
MPVNATVSDSDRPFSSAFLTLARFSAPGPLGRPMRLPWAAASCWPALVFSRILTLAVVLGQGGEDGEHELTGRHGGVDAQVQRLLNELRSHRKPSEAALVEA